MNISYKCDVGKNYQHGLYNWLRLILQLIKACIEEDIFKVKSSLGTDISVRLRDYRSTEIQTQEDFK